MVDETMLKEIPLKRVAPVDGMAVTADVWEEAHRYHRDRLRFHSLYGHGTGILTGLEVIASDPPDTSVYIRPGVAIGERGDMITLTDPVAFDIGHTSDGMLYLLLSYGEGRPRAGGQAGQDGAPYYVSSEFSIEAVSARPATPHVELARVRRVGRTAAIVDATDDAHPAENEIDARFRRNLQLGTPPVASMGVITLGKGERARHANGADRLAGAISSAGRQRVVVDHGVALEAELERYTLLYIVGLDKFDLSAGDMNAIYAYLQGGGTALYESCRQSITSGDPKADASFQEMLSSLGVSLEALAADHSLLSQPHLFASPPAGFEDQGEPDLRLAEGILYSAEDYGCLWNGERRAGRATREELRAAVEWGENILTFARRRRANANAATG